MSPVEEGNRGLRFALGAAVATSVVVAALGVAATRAVERAGFDPGNPYAWSQLSIGATAVFVGAFVAWRRPRHPIGWLLVLAGFGAWATFAAAPGIGWLMQYRPGWETLTRWLLAVGVSGWLVTRGVFLALVPLAFPGGFRRDPFHRGLRWASTAAVGTVAVAHSRLWTPEHFGGQEPTGAARLAERIEPWAGRAMAVLALVCLVDLVVRSVRSDARSRRGDALFAAAVALLLAPTATSIWSQFVHELPFDLWTLESWTMAGLPLVLAFAILRHRAMGMEVVVRRATLYLGVTLVGAGLYLSVVWAVATVRPDSSVAPVLGAGAVALTLGWVRDGLQRVLARRWFGSRDDPYTVLSALGSTLEAAPASDHALQAVTDTVCAQLRLPYAAAELSLEEATVRAAETGVRPTGADDVPATLERFALSHQGVALGELVVARRTPDEPLTDGERDLLGALARQAGVLAHNVTLVEALRRSRLVLLNAREEERRRIRADLHDGLGPTLATVAMGLEASVQRLGTEPEQAALLADLEGEMQAAIADVRTLVYNLRPAALDDLGLISAVREHARALAERSADTPTPLTVEIDAPDALGPLPAAVEVAAYRVALEALTNVARHARATACSVRIAEADEDGLALTIADDGVGGAESAAGGIGLQSMRDRVAELGGRFHLRSAPGGGTEVSAWFPRIEAVPSGEAVLA
jgi:signal transduction histidine kinase